MTFYGNDSFGGIANKTQNFEVVAQYQFDDFNSTAASVRGLSAVEG